MQVETRFGSILLNRWTRFTVLRTVLAVVAFLVSTASDALEFSKTEDNSILILSDCKDSKEKPCRPWERHFAGPVQNTYDGDAKILDRILSKQRFREVWLDSGGGNLDEGIKVGEILRKYKTFVRVPSTASCVSACTVAFLGGVVRLVDANANYEVHSYSSVLYGLTDNDRRNFMSDTEAALKKWAGGQDADAREWSARLLYYFQLMINGQPEYESVRNILTSKPSFVDTYRKNQGENGLAQQVALIRAEGEHAAHDVAFRIERAAMKSCIAILQQHREKLGARGDQALRMLSIMFESDIRRTFKLNDTTLREFGYVNGPPIMVR